MLWRRGHLTVAQDHERFRHHQTDASRLSGVRNVLPSQRGMVADCVGRLSVRHLPLNVASI